MSSAEIRQISLQGQNRNADKLFRAAVGAFSALTRPGRLDIAQLDDLTGPLFDATSDETRRFASATLSTCKRPPPALLARLCREPIETAAPLLVRSPAISDVELITLIGTHGLPHARAIARRRGLNKAITDLLGLLQDADIDRLLGHRPQAARDESEPGKTEFEGPAEAVRRRLRAMMVKTGEQPAVSQEWFGPDQTTASAASTRLFEFALLPDRKIFQESLAGLLGLQSARTTRLMGTNALWDFMVALRSLQVPGPVAFAIVALTSAEAPFSSDQTRLFFRRYEGIRPDIARERVLRWRRMLDPAEQERSYGPAANSDQHAQCRTGENRRAS